MIAAGAGCSSSSWPSRVRAEMTHHARPEATGLEEHVAGAVARLYKRLGGGWHS